MARLTIEDCTTKIPNKFELVCLASKRAEAISCGSPITVDRDNDKNAVIALREIAAEKIDIEQLRDMLIASLQTINKVDFIDEENLYAESKESSSDTDSDDDALEMFSHEALRFEDAAFDDNDNISEDDEKR